MGWGCFSIGDSGGFNMGWRCFSIGDSGGNIIGVYVVVSWLVLCPNMGLVGGGIFCCVF